MSFQHTHTHIQTRFIPTFFLSYFNSDSIQQIRKKQECLGNFTFARNI